MHRLGNMDHQKHPLISELCYSTAFDCEILPKVCNSVSIAFPKVHILLARQREIARSPHGNCTPFGYTLFTNIYLQIYKQILCGKEGAGVYSNRRG